VVCSDSDAKIQSLLALDDGLPAAFNLALSVTKYEHAVCGVADHTAADDSRVSNKQRRPGETARCVTADLVYPRLTWEKLKGRDAPPVPVKARVSSWRAAWFIPKAYPEVLTGVKMGRTEGSQSSPFDVRPGRRMAARSTEGHEHTGATCAMRGSRKPKLFTRDVTYEEFPALCSSVANYMISRKLAAKREARPIDLERSRA